jgi:hypothetical protein
MSDDFRSLSPRERVDVIERDVAAITHPDDVFLLPQQTSGWVEVAKLTLADDTLSDETRAERFDGWDRHLDAIPEAYADAARHELGKFWNLLDGRLRAGGDVDEDDEP